MKVLVAVDIVHPFDDCAEQLSGLLSLTDAEVTLLYVKEELPSYERLIEATADFQEDFGHLVERKAKEVLEKAQAQLNAVCPKVSYEIVSGPPAFMIESVARDESFDMIVVTPAHHLKADVLLLGSVSSAVVKHGPATTLICRSNGKKALGIRKALIATDGSDQANNAIKRAGTLFNLDKNNTEITLLHVVSVAEIMKMISPVEYIGIIENNLLLEGETFLANGKMILADAGFKNVQCVLKEGDPATEILNIAKSLPADIIITGAKGRTEIQHFLLGSVSHKIAMHAKCPTAVVKP